MRLLAALVLAATPTFGGSILVTGGNVNGTEGANILNVAVATFTDSALDPLSNYSATINWGDSTSASAGFVLQISGTLFEVLGSHTYIEEGSYWANVSVFDLDGDSGSDNATAIVSDAALTAATVGHLFVAPNVSALNANVAQFIDDNPYGTLTDFSASIAWGDATVSAGTVQLVSGNRFAVYGSHTYVNPGDYTVTTSVADVGGSTVSLFTPATVVPEPASAGLGLAGLLTLYAARRRRSGRA
jgi:MYXO-CTERM domain-containing protein